MESMRDLRNANVDFLAIGQYLRPSKSHIEVLEYVTPEKFSRLQKYGQSIEFKYVAAGPLPQFVLGVRKYQSIAVVALPLSTMLVHEDIEVGSLTQKLTEKLLLVNGRKFPVPEFQIQIS